MLSNSDLRPIWDAETCYPKLRSAWSNETPELGQCAVTSLLLQDIYGGEIHFDSRLNHFWNFIDGVDYDLTKNQFPDSTIISCERIINREELLGNPDTKNRYELLKSRFRDLDLPGNI